MKYRNKNGCYVLNVNFMDEILCDYLNEILWVIFLCGIVYYVFCVDFNVEIEDKFLYVII